MDLKEQIDKLIQEAYTLTAEALKTERLKNSQVKILRMKERGEIKDITDELEKIRKRNKKVRGDILKYWEKYHDKEKRLDFPSASILRKNYRELVVHNKTALVNALDRIGRLDLVDYTFKDGEVAKLIAQGKLQGINETDVKVDNNYMLQIGVGKIKDRDNGKITSSE